MTARLTNDQPSIEARLLLLDERLDRVLRLMVQAGDDLLSFFDATTSGFIRESLPLAEVPQVGATSTARSVIALAELANVAAEEDDVEGLNEVSRKALDAIAAVASGPLTTWLVSQPESKNNASANRINAFTDAQLAVAAIMAARLVGDCHQAEGAARVLARERLHELKVQLGWRGRVDPSELSGHDFVTLYVVRAAALAGVWQASDSRELAQRIGPDLAQQLGWHESSNSTRFDPGELVMQLALLAWTAQGETDTMLESALSVLAQAQHPDGAWPTSRVITHAGGKLLHIASYEIGLALATLLATRLAQGRENGVYQGLDILDRVLSLVEANRVERTASGYSGWGNDRTRYADMVESWATAVVLLLLCRLRDLVLALRDVEVLRRLGARRRVVLEPSSWPDAIRWQVSEDRNAQIKTELARISDPSESGNLAETIWQVYVQPIASSPQQRPNRVAASFLMPGQPGTRKTSLCRALAQALGWPLVILSPPLFLRDGIDGFERNADSVFRDLLRLRRAIVLFDECEDLVRRRPRDEEVSAAHRTAGAFITAGMLPRLQALHDHHWIIFALAFNGDMSDIDSAVVRQGRFDYRVEMKHPTLEAQRRYAASKVSEDSRVALFDALSRHAQKAVTWSTLDLAISIAKSGEPDAERILAALRSTSDDGPPILLAK